MHRILAKSDQIHAPMELEKANGDECDEDGIEAKHCDAVDRKNVSTLLCARVPMGWAVVPECTLLNALGRSISLFFFQFARKCVFIVFVCAHQVEAFNAIECSADDTFALNMEIFNFQCLDNARQPTETHSECTSHRKWLRTGL